MKKGICLIVCATMLSAQGMDNGGGGFGAVFKALGLTPENMLNRLGDVVEWTGKQARQIGDDIARNLEEGDKVEAYENVIEQLKGPDGKKGVHFGYETYFPGDIPALCQKLAKARNQREDAKGLKEAQAAFNKAPQMLLGQLDAFGKHAMEKEKVVAKAEVDGHFMAKAEEAKMKAIMNFFSQPRNLAYIVAATAGIIGSYYLIKYGVKIASDQLEQRLSRPQIVKETSRLSLVEKLWGVSPKDPLLMDDVIASDGLRSRLINIADDTRNANDNGDYLSNLLLYGPPGTGKTMFAKALAYYSDLDYALIPGSSLSKLSLKDGLIELARILHWAKHSEKGTVIIFDEAETLLPSRENASEKSKKLVTEFLAQIEKPLDKKIMFVLVTNRPLDLDIAVHSRMGASIMIPRPGKEELAKLMSLYSGKLMDQLIRLEDGLEKHFDELAQVAKDANLVGRDIELIFKVNVVRETRRSPEPIVTYQIVKKMVQDYIVDLKERDKFVLR